MKVYIAGSSAEIDRAEAIRDRLIVAGIEVTSTWMENIRKAAAADPGGLASAANPVDASHAKRREISLVDLREVDEAQVLLWLSPVTPTTGCWTELGYAHARCKRIVAVLPDDGSPLHRSIFTGLADTILTLEAAIEDLLVDAKVYEDPAAVLTHREREVMIMLADGLTNRQIADKLYISIKTVDTHRGHVLKKLNLANNSRLTRFAIANGYVSLA